jgi:hypothetical protein
MTWRISFMIVSSNRDARDEKATAAERLLAYCTEPDCDCMSTLRTSPARNRNGVIFRAFHVLAPAQQWRDACFQ